MKIVPKTKAIACIAIIAVILCFFQIEKFRRIMGEDFHRTRVDYDDIPIGAAATKPSTTRYQNFMGNVTEINKYYRRKWKSSAGAESVQSSYKCLGRQNVFESSRRRSCRFKNICYHRDTKEFTYVPSHSTNSQYQSVRKPIFYDRKEGPIYSFSEGGRNFIDMNAIPYPPKHIFFTPTVEVGSPPENATFIKNTHALWASWSKESSLGHLMFEELASAFIAMARFGMNSKQVQLLDMRARPTEQGSLARYQKFTKFAGKGISNRDLDSFHQYMDTLGDDPFVCFDDLVVASESELFIYFDMVHNEGKEPILFDYRNEILRANGFDPFKKPKKHRIVLVNKKETDNRKRNKRTHFRDIYNIEEVYEHLKVVFPFAAVEIISPSEISFEEEVSSLLNTSIIISPCGGISLSIPFMAIGSHAIIMDYYVGEKYMHQAKGDSASMEVSFWNLFPHITKSYYQILELEYDQVWDTKEREETTRFFASVKVNLERIEMMVREAMLESDLEF